MGRLNFDFYTGDDLRTEARFEEGLAGCACDENEFLSDTSDTCAACPDGQAKPASKPRGPETYEEWIGDCPSGVRCTVNGDCGVDELCVVESKSTKGCCRAPKGRDWEGFQEENCVVVPQSGHSSNSMRSFSTKGSQAQLGQQNSLVSLDSYAFPTHEKSVTLSAATTRSKVAAMKLQASAGDGDEDALSPV